MSRFLPYIHNLRGLAILIVVSVHARGYDTDWESHPRLLHFFQTLFDSGEGIGTVMFLFIGGFLFQYLTHHQFSYKKYLEQKFKVIIMPYLIISIPLILLRIKTNFESLSLPDNFNEHSAVYQFFYYLFTGSHLAPFWFINVIILIYLTAPALRLIDNEKGYRYGFPIILLIGLFTFRPIHNANPLLAYIHFVPIYIMGMWASFNKDRILAMGWYLLLPLIVVYLVVSGIDLLGLITLPRKFSFEEVLASKRLVFNVFFLKAIVLCFIALLSFHKLRHREMPFLEMLGHYSFGVFFVHYLYISAARKIVEVLHVTVDFSLLTYLIFFLLILLASISTVYFIKKLTGNYSRYLIGS